jgi:hypothetical protein
MVQDPSNVEKYDEELPSTRFDTPTYYSVHQPFSVPLTVCLKWFLFCLHRYKTVLYVPAYHNVKHMFFLPGHCETSISV